MPEVTNTSKSSGKDAPPASGAWFETMPSGNRQFFDLSPNRPYVLESGTELSAPQVAYETWGTLDAAASNAILVCHALTGDAHAHGVLVPASQHPDGGTTLLAQVNHWTPIVSLWCAQMFWVAVKAARDPLRSIQVRVGGGAVISPS